MKQQLSVTIVWLPDPVNALSHDSHISCLSAGGLRHISCGRNGDPPTELVSHLEASQQPWLPLSLTRLSSKRFSSNVTWAHAKETVIDNTIHPQPRSRELAASR